MFRLISSLLSLGARILFVVYALCGWQLALGAALGALTVSGEPLTDSQIKKLGRITPEGLIFSGDAIYYSDVVAKSGLVINLWPGGKLIFEYDSALTVDQKTAFAQACQAWTLNNTPVSCVERNGEASYVYVSSHNGEQCGGGKSSCSVYGMASKEQSQYFYIHSDSWNNQRVIQHEIGHAFGLIHEQQRPDRDAYVKIIFSNIIKDEERKPESNFETVKISTSTEYDFDSIMHYNNCVYAAKPCNPQAPTESVSTIFPVACNREIVGGTAITSLDLDGIKLAYAPKIFGLFNKNRRAECGVHDLSPAQTALICGSTNCVQAEPVTYNREESFHYEECSGGFVTDPENFKICPATKTLTYSHSNSANLACGIGDLRTKHYWDWSCACAKQSLNKLCMNVKGALDVAALEKLRSSNDPRDISTVRYLDQISGWQRLGYIDVSTFEAAGGLLMKNYLQDSYADRLFSLLCKMRVLIELNLYVKESYVLSHEVFLRLVREEGMVLSSN